MKQLLVTYDDAAKIFNVKDKASGRVFLKDGKLDGGPTGGAVQVSSASDATFGKGHIITVGVSSTANSMSKLLFDTPPVWGVASLTLYDDVPFVFVKESIFSIRHRTINVKRLITSEFAIDLGIPAKEIRTLGTAGLTAPD